MKAIFQFFRKGTEQFRWRYFSLRRMCWMSFFLFLFFVGWRLLFQKEGIEELAFRAYSDIFSWPFLWAL